MSSSIVVNPISLSFGTVAIGENEQLIVTVYNYGGTDLQASCSSSDSTFAVSPSSIVVTSSTSTNLTITFTPTDIIFKIVNITLTTNDPMHPTLIIPVTGVGQKSSISIDKTSINFGMIGIYDSKSLPLTIKNTGTVDLISSITFSNPVFSASQTSFTITPGNLQIINVMFSPLSILTPLSESLTIQSNSSQGAQIVTLAGQSESAQISVSMVPIDFGNVTIHNSKTNSLMVTNIGNVDALLLTMSINNSVFQESVATPFRIHPSQTSEIPITFTPTDDVAQAGNLNITTNDSVQSSIIIGLLGTGVIAPIINLSTTSINFGQVQYNTSLIKTFTINNTGVDFLNVSNIVSNNSKFVVAPITGHININASASFNITYLPTDLSGDSGQITITSNDPDSPTTHINLIGQGVSSSIQVQPQTLNFANVTVNTENDLSLQISNNSAVPLKITNITSDNPLFVIGSLQFPLTITGSQTITIGFLPIAIGNQTANIVISSNDFLNPTISIPVSGNGVVPEIYIKPMILDFSNVTIGQSSILTVAITNLGQGDLTINNIASSGATFSADQTSLLITSGQSQNLNITFLPTALGVFFATITLTNNDPNAPNIIISVSGVGASPSASVTPTSLSYNNVVLNNSKDATFTVKNSGQVDLLITLVSSLPEYVLSETNDTIPPGVTRTITVTFTPTSAHYYSGNISITTNDPLHLTDLAVSLDGSGIASPKIQVIPTTLNFSDAPMLQTKQLSLQINNQGSQTLTYNVVVKNPTNVLLIPLDVYSINKNSGSVAVNGQDTLIVSFTPLAMAPYEGDQVKLEIFCNDINTPEVDVPLIGQGIAAVLAWSSVAPKTWIPAEIKIIANQLDEVTTVISKVLDLTIQILNIVKIFIIDIEDLAKVTIEAIQLLIANFIADLEATGIYILIIAPGKNNVNPVKTPQLFQSLTPQEKEIFNYTKGWLDCVKGGFPSFISKVVTSFDDPGDGNKPTFSKDGMVGGYVLMVDSGAVTPDQIAQFLTTIQKLLKLFRTPWKMSFEPPSNVTAASTNSQIKVSFTPSLSILPKVYFIFRSLVQGGEPQQYYYTYLNAAGQSITTVNTYHDENGRPVTSYDLVGVIGVSQQVATILKTTVEDAEQFVADLFGSPTQAATALGNPIRFVYKDTDVVNDNPYYYVVASGYPQIGITDYQQIIDAGVTTADFVSKIDIDGEEISAKPVSEVKIQAIGQLSAEVSATPRDIVYEVDGGLARCRNYRCGFAMITTDKFADLNSLIAGTLTQQPNAGSVVVSTIQGSVVTTVSTSYYRVDYENKKIIVTNLNVFPDSASITVAYEYQKSLQTTAVVETQTVQGDGTVLTDNKPIDSTSVQVFAMSLVTQTPTYNIAVTFSVLNDKDGRIQVNSAVGTIVQIKYDYFSDFSDTDFFSCIRKEFSDYFFDITTCDNGTTICPGYDDVNCAFNNGSGCTNTNKSQRKIRQNTTFVPENIPFASFWDPIACQNSIMKERCDGYSKIFPARVYQKQWPDWEAYNLSALGMFPMLEKVMRLMENLMNSLLAGTEKMSDAITKFIDTLTKKLTDLKLFIELVNSYIQNIVNDFDIPNIYFLYVPFASGGNDYLKTSIQNATNGPIPVFDPVTGTTSASNSYTAGVVLVFGTPGPSQPTPTPQPTVASPGKAIADALKIIFGG